MLCVRRLRFGNIWRWLFQRGLFGRMIARLDEFDSLTPLIVTPGSMSDEDQIRSRPTHLPPLPPPVASMEDFFSQETCVLFIHKATSTLNALRTKFSSQNTHTILLFGILLHFLRGFFFERKKCFSKTFPGSETSTVSGLTGPALEKQRLLVSSRTSLTSESPPPPRRAPPGTTLIVPLTSNRGQLPCFSV